MSNRLALGCLVVATVALGVLCPGCGPRPEDRPTERDPGTRVYYVSPNMLYRDYGTAKSYEGQWVRLTLGKGDYAVSGTDIMVYAAENDAPPTIVFRPLAPYRPVPDGKTRIVVTGVVTSVVRDGHWRSRLVDFYVVVERVVIE